jgi:sortase A
VNRRLAAARAGAALLAALALLPLIDALHHPAKAWLGQVLLERAWRSGAGEPWSGADIRPLARLFAPATGDSVLVLDSASGKAMAWGPGHVAGTATPGAPGLSAVGGHRDSHMAFLGRLGPGDELVLSRSDGRDQVFAVTHAEVVDSRVWRYPAITDGPPRLALTTCWPLDAGTPGPYRLVVYAVGSH